MAKAQYGGINTFYLFNCLVSITLLCMIQGSMAQGLVPWASYENRNQNAEYSQQLAWKQTHEQRDAGYVGQGNLNKRKQELSRAFELRYVSDNPAADGETDFKGETEVFDTDQRVEYLKHWAEYGSRFFNDPHLDTKIVSDEEVRKITRAIKPQPLPEVRSQILLDNWKYLGYRSGQRKQEQKMLEAWQQIEGVTIEDGHFVLRNSFFRTDFPEQPWRMKLNWRAKSPDTMQRIAFRLSDYVEVGFTEHGRFYYIVNGVKVPAGAYLPGEFYDFKVEVDPDGGLGPDYDRSDVRVSGQQNTHPAAYAALGWNFWRAENNDYPQWISYDMGEVKSLKRARLAFRQSNDRTYQYFLEVSIDGQQWTRISDEQWSGGSQWEEWYNSQGADARYVRVMFTGASHSSFEASLAMAEFFDENGRILLVGEQPPESKFSFYVDGKQLDDHVPVSRQLEKGEQLKINSFGVETDGKVVLDHIWGVGYDQVTRENVRRYPYVMETFFDWDFTARPDPRGFYRAGYDDSDWRYVPYRRYAHGGERRKKEALYLRRTVHVDDFERAVLNVETVRPSADIYINGRHVAQVGRLPERIDISEYLKPDRDNLIAVRVDPYRVEWIRDHMSSDPFTGWYAGLMDIELFTGPVQIEDVFAYATHIDSPANLRLQVKTATHDAQPFDGRMVTRVYPWYPEASTEAAGESVTPVHIAANEPQLIIEDILVADPLLWNILTPNLYKVHVLLQDSEGNNVDDFVLTTGLRTISQEGGTFRINGEPEMLNGPLLFGHHYPLERIAQWMFSPPKERWVHDILLTKRMNGTVIRMSVHDRLISGVNDRRLAQIGDQMGIMFMWQTPTWVREGPVTDFDFEGLPKYAKAVRNHPSIVMWQPANHPRYTIEWFQRVHDTLAEVDQTRLISPSADMSRMRGEFENTIGDTWRPADDDTTWPAWTSPLIARGTMEQILGYGQEWTSLRLLPGLHPRRGMELEVRMAYLNSKTHAWFDFESEETIGQDNWNLIRGKPYHHMHSYELGYDVGSIGRILHFDEWRESQAWQALSAYEAYRKKRWLGFDGMTWCPLRNGGNTATYKKPLVDYHNHAKLSYHAVTMAFQPVLAGSKNVDIVYGPGDTIPVMVMNLGKSRTVDVKVVVRSMDGSKVAGTLFENVKLPSGKGVVDLGEWMPELEREQYYAFEYIVLQ